MADHTTQTDCAVEIGKPIFQPFPPSVHIHEYAAFEPLAVRLIFRNNDKFARRLRVIPPDSPVFSVMGPTTTKGLALADGRAAPGTEIVYTVTFTPASIEEYAASLVCVTEREKFVVPLRAEGRKAMLVMPDAVPFPSLPVRSATPKVFVVRNVGSKPAEFTLTPPPGFAASPSKGFVEPEQTVPVTLTFRPMESRPYECDMGVAYTDGSHSHACFVELSGAGHDVDVTTDSAALMLGSTYVSLEGKARLTVTNRSDLPLEFCWKAFAGLAEEEDARALRLAQLEEQYVADRAALDASVHRAAAAAATGAGAGAGYGGEEEDGAGGSGGGLSLQHQAELVALERRYRGQRAEAEAQSLDFLSSVFDIQPACGTVWSRSAMEFTVLFRPNDSREFVESAFLEITGRSARLPLTLSGVGIGPRLAFAYDVVDVGDVSVTSVHRYELLLSNRGEIEAEWHLTPPPTPFGSRFLFDPPTGVIRVGESVPISAYFTSEAVGAFSEVFELAMTGCTAVLRVHFKGVVVPPSFSLSSSRLDFGTVPFDFPQERSFGFTNTSDVPLTFTLRIPQDEAGMGMGGGHEGEGGGMLQLPRGGGGGSSSALSLLLAGGGDGGGFHRQREFTIQPASATLQPRESATVLVQFTSNTLQSYAGYYLSVGVEGVAEELTTLPISATCMVPTVTLQTETLQYGSCFLRYPYTQRIVLVNKDPVPARYELLPQDEQTAVVAAFSSPTPEGVLPPLSETAVEVQLLCYRGGPFVLPLFVRIAGTEGEEPLKAELQGLAIGPNVVCSPTSIAWGPVTCLRPHTASVSVHNDSAIPAPVRLSMKNGLRSRFTCSAAELMLAPGEKTAVTVTALLDDAAAFADELHVTVTETGVVPVPLTARGVGCTVASSLPWEGTHAFGPVFTNSATGAALTFTCENRGRRNQTVSFVNASLRARELEAKKDEKKRGTDAGATAASGASGAAGAGSAASALQPVFSVDPPQMMLKPGQVGEFTLRGYSERAGLASEVLEWLFKGENDRGFSPVSSLTVTAQVTDPLLAFDPPQLAFVHEHTPAFDIPHPRTGQLPSLLQTRPLTLINTSRLPLEFTLRCGQPFSLDQFEFTLPPEGRTQVAVTFDPTYREDRQSHAADGKITVQYREHPRRDTLRVVGDIRFPNLRLDTAAVEFGCVLNDTVASRVVHVTNTSALPVDASWAFDEELTNHDSLKSFKFQQRDDR
jgi:hydrocephalus-inducing protein